MYLILTPGKCTKQGQRANKRLDAWLYFKVGFDDAMKVRTPVDIPLACGQLCTIYIYFLLCYNFYFEIPAADPCFRVKIAVVSADRSDPFASLLFIFLDWISCCIDWYNQSHNSFFPFYVFFGSIQVHFLPLSGCNRSDNCLLCRAYALFLFSNLNDMCLLCACQFCCYDSVKQCTCK